MATPEWIFARTQQEALEVLEASDAGIVAGGTTIIDLMKMGHRLPGRLVDISRLPLDGIEHDGETLIIGATATNSAVAANAVIQDRFPALSEAILLGASQQIRNAATVAGNIMQATRCAYFRDTGWPCNRREPGSGCEALRVPLPTHAVLGTSDHCIAVHPSDLAVALLALNAMIRIEDRHGVRRIGLSDFYALPGDTPAIQTVLPQGALITAVEIPSSAGAGNSGYIKLRARASYEFAAASAAAAIEIRDGIIQDFAVAIGGIATRPWRNRAAEQAVTGKRLSNALIDRFCDRLLEGADLRPETEHKLPLVRGAIHQLVDRLAGK